MTVHFGGKPATRLSGKYRNRHTQVRKIRGAQESYLCEGGCGGFAHHWATLADRDGYFLEDYLPLCRRCHRKYDHIAEKVTATLTRKRELAEAA
jgi:hypothetical protein